MENLLRVYQMLGYNVCEIQVGRVDVEKIAIYAEPDGLPTHAAANSVLASGRANLGSLRMFEHTTLESLEGSMAR